MFYMDTPKTTKEYINSVIDNLKTEFDTLIDVKDEVLESFKTRTNTQIHLNNFRVCLDKQILILRILNSIVEEIGSTVNLELHRSNIDEYNTQLNYTYNVQTSNELNKNNPNIDTTESNNQPTENITSDIKPSFSDI